MSNAPSVSRAAVAQASVGETAVIRLAWVFGDRDTLMLLRLPVLIEVTLRRHKLLAIAPGLTAIDQAVLKQHGIDSAPLTLPSAGFNPLVLLTARRRLVQLLAEWRTGAVVIEDGEDLDLAVRAAKQAGVAAIYPMLPALEAGPGPGGSKKSWRPALSLATAVFAPTPNDARLLTEPLAKLDIPHYHLPATCVDLERVRAVPLPPLDGGFVFLGSNGGTFSSGSSTFVAAVNELAGRGASARFRLAQIQKNRPGTAANSSERVETVMIATDIPEHLRELVAAAHVVVIDGLVAHQMLLSATALAIGRPVLVVNHPCYRDFVDIGVNGWLVPGGDPAALADGMVTTLKRPDLLPGMARAARQKAERRLDQRATLQTLFQVLRLADLRARAA